MWLSRWRIARRDLRGSLAGFLVFFACTALGVATIATVGVLNAGITSGLARDASALLGGDVEIEQPNYPIPPEELATLVPPGAKLSHVVRTNGIAFSAEEQSLAVQIKGVDGAYPLFGTLESEPAAPIEQLLADGGALVEEGLLARLGVSPGDQLRVGTGTIHIAGVLTREPDRVGRFVALGPRIIVAGETLDHLGILLPGALARYEYRLALADPHDADATVARLKAEHPEAVWRARSRTDIQPSVARFTDRLATYLMMAGLTALVIGGLGIGLSVRAYLEGKTESIATLRSIGATAQDIGRIYGMQLALLAIGGTAIGVVLGQAAPFALAPLVKGLFPVEIVASIEPLPLVHAALCGLLTVGLFAYLPLARCRDVAPAAIFRAGIEADRRRASPRRLFVVAIIGSLLAGLVLLGAPRFEIAGVFIASVVGGMVVLSGAAKALLWSAGLIRPWTSPPLALALASLGQPGNGAVSVVVALGAGLAALVLVGLVQHNLQEELLSQLPQRAPKLVFIDIQPSQVETFRATVAQVPEAKILQLAPVLRARVVKIAGEPVDDATVADNVRWTTREDRGLTYQAEPAPETVLVAGDWWPADYSGEPLVSVEDEVAIGYGVGVGDMLSFNILGRVVDARIANLRQEIDWSRGRLDFVFILSPGVVDRAPHTSVAAVDVPKSGESTLIAAMAAALPNVTPISIGDAVARVGEIMGKIGAAIRIVAGVTLVTGLLVLASAVVASRRQQIRRAVLLKVLGGRRIDILRLLLMEHAGLGVVAAIVGGALGMLGAWLIVGPTMGMSFDPAPSIVLATSLAAVLLSAAVGGVMLRRALTVPAATILRRP